ncbi:flagellar export protein FliJ [bacterium E08(2017)]|nr:flagellar export protein FliJ [bacterium E08(2017)]
MKAFSFSLQRLLDVKSAVERQSEVELAEAQKKLQKARRKKEQLEESFKKYSEVFAKLGGTADACRELTIQIKYIHWLEKKIQSQERRIASSSNEVEERRRNLVEIMKERKSLERLSEREFEAWQEKSRQQSRNAMDEIASTRFQLARD